MQRRLVFATALVVFTIVALLSVISLISVGASIEKSLNNQLYLSQTLSKHIDYILRENLTRLHDISLQSGIDFGDGNWEPERKVLKTAYEYSLFTDGVFLVDKEGNVVATYPYRRQWEVNLLSIPYIDKALTERKPVVSNLYTLEPSMRKVLFMLVPIKDKDGEFIGLAAGEVNPTSPAFTQMLRHASVHEDICVELVDSHGTIIASTEPKRVFTSADHNQYIRGLIAQKKAKVGTCHRCHNTREGTRQSQDVLALAPLTVAPWGISLREPGHVVFMPATMLKKGFVLLGLIAIAGCMILAVGINRSIVRPIKALTRATQEIARGNLHKPVSISTSDEIGLLAKSFDQMRVRLAQSLQHIQRHAQELELQVAERTKDLLQSRQRLSKLLEQTISAQEDERKRIARELHDEITQPLNALLISLELMDMSLKQDTHLRKNISQLRQHLLEVLQSIHSLIKDLRPPVIDDFGLESAVVWLLQRHLSKAGIEFVFRTHGRCTEDPFTGSFRCADLEFAIFRVVQEAIVNIVKHSRASMVAVALLFSPSSVRIEIEDDGEGFDVHKAFASTKGPGTAGLGLLGMKERIALLDGRFTICSWPGGGGTHISITVPL